MVYGSVNQHFQAFMQSIRKVFINFCCKEAFVCMYVYIYIYIFIKFLIGLLVICQKSSFVHVLAQAKILKKILKLKIIST